MASTSDRVALSVIVPVFNEDRTISEVLKRLARVPYTKEVIVVNDGSFDETAGRLAEWRGVSSVKVFEHDRNLGKGRAIRTGLIHARGRFVIIQDADLEYDPEDYGRLLDPLLGENGDLVFGSRRLTRRWNWRDWLNPFYYGVSLLNCLVRLWYGVRLTDEATCLKVFPLWALRAMDLECERFEFCPEVTAKACRMGLKILEVPISYHPRSVRDGKKIRFRDGWEAVRTLWKFRHWNPSASRFGLSRSDEENREAPTKSNASSSQSVRADRQEPASIG